MEQLRVWSTRQLLSDTPFRPRARYPDRFPPQSLHAPSTGRPGPLLRGRGPRLPFSLCQGMVRVHVLGCVIVGRSSGRSWDSSAVVIAESFIAGISLNHSLTFSLFCSSTQHRLRREPVPRVFFGRSLIVSLGMDTSVCCRACCPRRRSERRLGQHSIDCAGASFLDLSVTVSLA